MWVPAAKFGPVVSSSVLRVYVGSSSLSNQKVYRVQKIDSDSRHISGINDYDVAVLTLSTELEYSYCVAPICLPRVNTTPRQGTVCTAAGWGTQRYGGRNLTPLLQKVNLPIVDQNSCVRSYGSRYINNLKICAGDYRNGGIDTCQGDSGGPLMCMSGGRYFLQGIVSFGSGCGRPYYPGIYTRVAHPLILDFIQKSLN
ncbi:chymotrypsinogen A [Aplysia californica]|uniref:Chymotrypsinogen A n=1 Tax=Aplysia californica TaxID=6500 RepID=A0ABM1VP81_APLCA|nr:chymotrypsinogen A [Aplysia californica]